MTIFTTTTALRRAAGIGAAILVLVVAGCGGSGNKATASTASTSSSAAAATTTTAPAGTSVAFDNSAPLTTPFTPACSPTDPADCVTPLSYGSVETSGDLTGTSVAAGAASIYKDSAVGSILGVFRGTVTGCGTGRILMVVTGGVTSGEWNFVDNSGSDDLKSLTGAGTYTIDTTGVHYKGVVHCK